MPIHVINQRKAVLIGWDTNEVKGKYATIEGKEADGFEEKLQVPNDGNAVVHYGEDFTGESTLRVSGSKSGEETGTIEVE